MKKYIILLFISFLSYVSFAQKWEDTVTSDPAYMQYKEDALKFYGSADYKLEFDTRKDFREKMGKAISSYDYKDFEKWINTNLDKTTFTSKEEAIKLFNIKKEITHKNNYESKRLAGVFNKLADEFGYEPFLELTKKEIHNVILEKHYKKTE